jgi:short-subunit dehydrogenase
MTKLHGFKLKYGPWVVVTGASAGIGMEFARQLAAENLNIVLVARRDNRLVELSKAIEKEYGVQVRVIRADLTTRDGIAKIKEQTDDLDVGLLVNNAGREDSGRFVDTDVEDALATLHLNTRAPMLLSHHFAQRMIKRDTSGIIFLSSIVAFQGVPYIANYAATKAYDLIFAESLAAELKPDGVDVLAVAPGFAATDLSPDFDFTGLPMKPMSPETIVKNAVASLGNQRLAVPGLVNKFLYYSGKYLMPRAANSASFGKVFSAVLRHKIRADVSEPAQLKEQTIKS